MRVKSEQCWSRLRWQRIHTRSSYHAGPPRTQASHRVCVCIRVWQMSMRVIRCVYIVIHPWLHIEMCDFLESLEGVYVCVCVWPEGTYYYSCLFLSLPSLPACTPPPTTTPTTHTHTEQFYFNLTNLSSHKNGGMFGALALSVHTEVARVTSQYT